jgi:hypothetical protein
MSLVHSLGITLWTFVLTTHTQACGVKEDNVCITAPHLLVTTPSRKPSCGRPALMHRHTELSTAPIHGSSTASKQRQQQQQGLSTQSTGPMTMTRPQRYGLRLEYLGTNGPQDERLNIETSTLNPPDPPAAQVVYCQMLANRLRGTRVDPHLCNGLEGKFLYCCAAASTHACRRAGYR